MSTLCCARATQNSTSISASRKVAGLALAAATSAISVFVTVGKPRAGSIALMPFAAGFESVGDVAPIWRLTAAFAYRVLAVSVFAYILWFRILTLSGATAASSYHFLIPPLGMLFGWLLLGERMDLADMLGIVPVALGIYLVTRPTASIRS